MTTTGSVDPLATAPRYTDLGAVKAALGIASADATLDVELTQAIVAAETAIDAYNGRSFPDPPGGPIEGIPEAIRLWSLDAAVEVWNLRQTAAAPPAGYDDWVGGSPDTGQAVRQALRRHPLALGYRAAGPFA